MPSQPALRTEYNPTGKYNRRTPDGWPRTGSDILLLLWP